ncbi:MAG: cytochrome c family protein [Devosia sp.]|uniref:c-type cytochrome n=1 Tax=Devosia sp. TaxID=1871048 RepID=UPI001AC9438C|nr:cytochrome c family protein [Devosia sp.]MBN9316815.1 cytochrome c family protein [Devosia sp.]
MIRITIAVAAVMLSLTGAMAQGDPTAGEQVFKKCAACHAVGDGAQNKVGPVLNAVMGRTAGTLEGYNYSQAMKDAGAGGLVWTPETLAKYLPKPRDLVKGTKMTFPGLPNPDDVANVIAYLATFSPDFKPALPQQ